MIDELNESATNVVRRIAEITLYIGILLNDIDVSNIEEFLLIIN